MNSTKATILIVTVFLAAVLVLGCGDDDPVGPNNGIPTELVGTWWWVSATLNGVPQTFPEISFTDSSQTGSVTFSVGNTWNAEEYYNQIIVWTQSGTCSASGNDLTISRTMENSVPVDPPEDQTMQFEVIGTNLIISDVEIFMDDTLVVIQTYTKE